MVDFFQLTIGRFPPSNESTVSLFFAGQAEDMPLVFAANLAKFLGLAVFYHMIICSIYG